MLKMLYFIKGNVATEEEKAEMEKFRSQGMRVFERNSKAAEEDNIEKHDKVGGLVPWFYAQSKDDEHEDHGSVSTETEGLIVNVDGIDLCGFKGDEGTITLLKNGTWFIGFDLFSREIIALPRLGHGGWIPVLKCVTGESNVLSMKTIDPLIPPCRIPNTVAKITSGDPTHIITMGGAMFNRNSTDEFFGYLVSQFSSYDLYRLASNVSITTMGSNNNANFYTLSNTGFFGSHTGDGRYNSGSHSALGNNKPINGSSEIVRSADLVILSCLNSGEEEMRIECIEPIVRNLRKMGIEVLIVSDFHNKQSGYRTYASVTQTSKYNEGNIVREIAERYGCQFADTAAYVAEAVIRYQESVPMIVYDQVLGGGYPTSRTGEPSCAQEVFCRAVRSTIPIQSHIPVPVETEFDTSESGHKWTAYKDSNTSVTWLDGSVQAEKTTDAETNEWGLYHRIPELNNGDKIIISCDLVMPAGGYVDFCVTDFSGDIISTKVSANNSGAYNGSITLNEFSGNGSRLRINTDYNVPMGSILSVDDFTISVEPTIGIKSSRINDLQEMIYQKLPPSRVLSDYTVPGGCTTILGKDEYLKEASLGGSMGYNDSYVKHVDTSIADDKQALVLTEGKSVILSANGMVSCAIMVASDTSSELQPVLDIYIDGELVKTSDDYFNSSEEKFVWILRSKEFKAATPNPMTTSVRIKMRETGANIALHISALIAFTSEQTFIKPEQITYVGSWGNKVDGGAGMLGYATDTADDYAMIMCPQEPIRLGWVVSRMQRSRSVDVWNCLKVSEGLIAAGSEEVAVVGNLIGRETGSYIKLNESFDPGNEVDGWGLHIGGAIFVHDR